MNKAIISGATGAIGTALVKTLINNNVDVLILTRSDSTRLANIPNDSHINIMNCGMEDYAGATCDGKDYDVFYHLAWAGTTGASRNDAELQSKNIDYALDAVAMAKRFGCKVFIGAGSQAEYGRVEGILKASTPTNPETEYGKAKLTASCKTRDYAHEIGLLHIWTRIVSIYGPHDGAQTMVMSTIDKLKHGETPQFTKGEQLWDYLYSEDAAEALYLMGDKALESTNKLKDDQGLGISSLDGKIYVIGSGKVKPLAEYIEIIRDIVSPGASLDMGVIPYAPKQVMHLQADVTDLSEDLGWKPSTEFKDGIEKILKETVNVTGETTR